MYRFELDKSEYYDFILTDDEKIFYRDTESYKLFSIDVTQSLSSISGVTQNDDVILENITLVGYDNGLLAPPITGTTGVTFTVSSGTTFTLHPVTGYVQDTKYEIDTTTTGYTQLNGGFYQGFFKLYGYPVEFFKNRMRKGWTVNMILHMPLSNVTGTTLNNTFNNTSGFIYYIGTRAENKYETLTPMVVTSLTQNYGFDFVDGPSSGYTQTTITTYGDEWVGTGTSTGSTFVPLAASLVTNPYYDGEFVITSGDTYQAQPLALSGNTYSGHFKVIDGITYDPYGNILTYDEKYSNIIENAFGIRITTGGTIGYRTIYATDPCYTGETQDVSGITADSFVDYTSDCDSFTVKKIITKYFTVEESYTKASVINFHNPSTPAFLNVSVVYERDVTYDTDCELEFGTYKNGTLMIYLNGFIVYRNHNVREVIPHKLDTDKRLQEGVPFNLSFGGGTQGLYDAVYPDTGATFNTVLDKFFAGTFNGGVRLIEMYSTPLYLTEIRSIINNDLQSFILFKPNGGRTIFVKTTLP
jgi:hypothetical protein